MQIMQDLYRGGATPPLFGCLMNELPRNIQSVFTTRSVSQEEIASTYTYLMKSRGYTKFSLYFFLFLKGKCGFRGSRFPSLLINKRNYFSTLNFSFFPATPLLHWII